MRLIDLSGVWQCEIPGQRAQATLPGTLDTNGIGFPDTGANQWHQEDADTTGLITEGGPIATRLTRRVTYEGPAVFSRTIERLAAPGKRLFLECERARHLRLLVNGVQAEHIAPHSISAPHVFEVTGLLTGHDRIELIDDNSYPGWPREDIVYSSAATDETQTNWNGILGYIRLREEEENFIEALRVYPAGDALDLCVRVNAAHAGMASVSVCCDALDGPASLTARLAEGAQDLWLRGLPLADGVRRWDEGEGNLYDCTAVMGESRKTVRFGVRSFGAKEGCLALNGRRIFLRSEANCCVFPEEGHPPMTKDAWLHVLGVYRSYGVNCMRFHSHCPPEAAFEAADEMGMLMQPELSHWNPKDAFSAEESRAYYRAELEGILAMLANHPSFVMLSFGNELHADETGHAAMDELADHARALDATRLYATGSNNHYGKLGCDAASDFYTSSDYGEHMIRATSSSMLGWLNREYPDLRRDYAEGLAAMRRERSVPVFSFEVGQYEVLPDFDELEQFSGVTIPDNLRLIRDKVAKKGLLDRWKAYSAASGELSLIGYRAEIEAALRTEGLSGISLLGLQDFPGQGTALVGMLNCHLEPKPHPFAQPERFAQFFRGVLPLVLLERFTYLNTQTLTARVRMANYGREALCGEARWTLAGGSVSLAGTLGEAQVPCGGLSDLGQLEIALGDIAEPTALKLTISLCGHENSYPIWVYPDAEPVCPEGVHECRTLDARACEVLSAGGAVYLSPASSKEAMPASIQGQFSTDFWSVGTFPVQEGGMGLLIDDAHPVFAGFPTAMHTDWQWWPMASRRALILDASCADMEPIITQMDSYAYLRPMAMLFECRCGGGRLLVSSMGLQDLQAYPEARALLSSIYAYAASDAFAPVREIAPEVIRSMIHAV